MNEQTELRTYFAGQSLAGLLAHGAQADSAVNRSFQIAEEMMTQLKIEEEYYRQKSAGMMKPVKVR